MKIHKTTEESYDLKPQFSVKAASALLQIFPSVVKPSIYNSTVHAGYNLHQV